jgi:hypothetical protein
MIFGKDTSRFAHNGLASFKGERACVATTSAPRPVANASNLTDIPPPPPETPIILLLFAALAGAVLTAVGYVVHGTVWPGHDPVALLLRLWH